MNAIKKWAPLAAIALAAIALILYVFAPVIKVMDETSSVWDSITDDHKTPMIIVTVVLAVLSVVLTVGCYLKKEIDVLRYATTGVMILTAIFCFCSKAFIVADLEMEAFDSLIDLGAGAILGGILFILSAAVVIVPKFLKGNE